MAESASGRRRSWAAALCFVCYRGDDEPRGKPRRPREHKLRTVLWGWVGQPLDEEELAGLRTVSDALDAELGQELTNLLDDEEIAALAERCATLRSEGHFPAHRGQMPAVPWPSSWART